MGVMLTATEMDELAALTHARVAVYRKNEMISLENKDERTLCCLREGLAYLCMENEHYERSILCAFRPGEAFSAEMVLGVPGGVSYLIAKYPVRVLFVGQGELRRLCMDDARWCERTGLLFMRQLPEGLLAHSYMLHQKSPRMRLLTYLRWERALQGSGTLALPMPFSDLADYLNVDRSALMKEIARLKREGMLSGTRRNVVFYEQPD